MRKLLETANCEGQEKVSEKNLLVRGIVTLTVVILCLAAMTITAFAYYSLEIVSGSNRIKAAVFDIDVTIRGSYAEATVVPGTGKTYTAHLAAGTYEITVARTQKSTANTGFATMEVTGLEETYYTRQLTLSENADVLTFTFVTNVDTTLKFAACWGTSIYHNTQADVYITENKTVELLVEGVSDEGGREPMNPDTTEPKTTEPEPTVPEVTEPETTEPTVTEPEVTDPEVTDPATTEPEDTGEAGGDETVIPEENGEIPDPETAEQ